MSWTIAKVSSYSTKYVEDYLTKHNQKYGEANPHLYLLDYLNRCGLFSDKEAKLITDPKFRELYTEDNYNISTSLRNIYPRLNFKDVTRIEAIYLILSENTEELARSLSKYSLKYIIETSQEKSSSYIRYFGKRLYTEASILSSKGEKDFDRFIDTFVRNGGKSIGAFSTTRQDTVMYKGKFIDVFIKSITDDLLERDLNDATMEEAYFMTISKNVYPYIPKVYQVDSNNITMEYIEGDMLIDYLRDNQDQKIFDDIYTRVLYIIGKLKSINVIHGDMNLTNFMIDDNGNLWLIDFGLASYGGQDDIVRVKDWNYELEDEGISIKFGGESNKEGKSGESKSRSPSPIPTKVGREFRAPDVKEPKLR